MASEQGGAPRRPWLARLGLDRPELRAWALYDWANSAFFTTVVTAVFPIYYSEVAAAGRSDVLGSYSRTTTYAMLLVALVGPVLGAIADTSSRKKPFLGAFLVLGVLATAALWFVGQGDWKLASALFVIANVGVAGSFVFYDALLPVIAREDELDRVSSAGYALGYLGGGVLLALNVLWILHPEWFGMTTGTTTPVRLAFVSVAVWWALFSIPLFRRVHEPRRALEPDESGRAPIRDAFRRLRETFGEVRNYRNAFLLMLAMLIYNDGINTIIRMATLYGRELGMEGKKLIPAILVVQFVGFPCAFGFGWIASRIGAKRAVMLGLAVYVGVTLIAYTMDSIREFYALAIGVALVQGGCQALTRSLFASMVPRHKSGEFFGLFAVLERFSQILGPLAFNLAIEWTGNPRNGVLPLIAFFVVGALILSRVDVEAGRRTAREADASVLSQDTSTR